MAKTPGRKGRSGKGKESKLSEVRRIVSEFGLTIEDVFPDDAPDVPENPCANESAGFLICNGTDREVVPFPAGGPWVVTVTDGVVTFTNPTAVPQNAAPEQAPEPRPANGGPDYGGPEPQVNM